MRTIPAAGLAAGGRACPTPDWSIHMSAKRFPPRVVNAVRDSKIIGIRAGTEPHKIIGVWVVVVENRVFVRSWSMKPRSWWRTFLVDSRGVMAIDGREIPIRAIQTKSERLKDAVSKAYAEKYSTKASLGYVRDFAQPKRRDTTTELVPL
jgi:hypothetical protein